MKKLLLIHMLNLFVLNMFAQSTTYYILSTYDKVYFIDRSEIKDGMMKMYPVKEVKSRF